MALRKYRSNKHPYEFMYEAKVEEIEGTANYVEWKVLEQLDKKKATELFEKMADTMTKPDFFFPIRIPSYYIGALMVRAMTSAGEYAYSAKERPVICSALKNIAECGTPTVDKETTEAVAKTLSSFNEETKEIIDKAIKNNEVLLDGPAEIVALNVYDARSYQGYLTSRFILMYKVGEETKTINDNCIIKMQDDRTIEKVYRWV